METILPQLIAFAKSFFGMFFYLLELCIMISILLSWFASGRTQLGSIVESIVYPLYKPFRWARIGMISLAPIGAILCLWFLRVAVMSGLDYLGTLL